MEVVIIVLKDREAREKSAFVIQQEWFLLLGIL